jgi:hypothetical protein
MTEVGGEACPEAEFAPLPSLETPLCSSLSVE